MIIGTLIARCHEANDSDIVRCTNSLCKADHFWSVYTVREVCKGMLEDEWIADYGTEAAAQAATRIMREIEGI